MKPWATHARVLHHTPTSGCLYTLYCDFDPWVVVWLWNAHWQHMHHAFFAICRWYEIVWSAVAVKFVELLLNAYANKTIVSLDIVWLYFLTPATSSFQVAKFRDMVQHPCICGPRLNIAPKLFLYFLCHPYTLITFVENFCSLLRWRVCWSSVAGRYENPHSERYLLRCHFYKKNTARHICFSFVREPVR